MSEMEATICEQTKDMTNEKSPNCGRTHRVGSITVGLCMILFGVLFFLHTVLGYLNYSLIFSLWPVIFISMGVELLLANFTKGKLIFDKGAVVILILMTFLAVGLACVDVGMDAAEWYMEHNNMVDISKVY